MEISRNSKKSIDIEEFHETKGATHCTELITKVNPIYPLNITHQLENTIKTFLSKRKNCFQNIEPLNYQHSVW